jgi:hypothetical protein
MSQEHDQSSPIDAHVHEGIHAEPPPFEPGYQPESLPQISVPDLAPDAEGLTAEALSQVPTLTELVDEAPGQALVGVGPEMPVEAAPIAQAAEVSESPAPAEAIQDTPVQADTWVEELHVRMGRLTDDIHTLNARLDRLDERNKTTKA